MKDAEKQPAEKARNENIMTITPESAYYALDGPLPQRRAALMAIIRAADESEEEWAAALASEARESLEEMDQ